ncbi:hypothetical protein [Vibrio barjaei]|uniref:Uncharacterized protein n=1 Tax=Vibrio barjaei TaxID=1676683 RepID=A0ABW7IFI1_9VIBR|nr:hypothetical protein [Vibrio barjaei]MCY9871311.1 hypothetical protein [Vibrio barjaei]OIN24700.1 hypothetical protein AWH66_2019350 [Vibrio barjaei]
MPSIIQECNRELKKVLLFYPEEQRSSVDCMLAQLMCCEIFLIQYPILNHFRGKSSPWYHVQNIRYQLLSQTNEKELSGYELVIFQGWSMAKIDDARIYEKPIPERVRRAYLDYQFFVDSLRVA